MVQLERDNLEYIAETVKQQKWEVDFWKGEKIEGELGIDDKCAGRERVERHTECSGYDGP